MLFCVRRVRVGKRRNLMQSAQNLEPSTFRSAPAPALVPPVTRAGLRPLLRAALSTDGSKTLLFQRVVLAGVILPHGLQKAFGWFGGWGFDDTIAWFQSALGVPGPVAALVIAADFLGALALAFGLFSRLTALGVALTMLGAIFLVHAPNGFFMNWAGTAPGEGYEFH